MCIYVYIYAYTYYTYSSPLSLSPCSLARLHCEATLPQTEETLFSSQISVQFLNRPGIVFPLVEEHGYMETLLSAMRRLHREDLLLWKRARTPGGPKEARRQMPIVSDLRFVLAISGVPALVLRRGRLVEAWLSLLTQLQGIDTQRRAVTEHVARDHDEWIGTFNFFIGFQSLYGMLVKPLVKEPDIAAAPGSEAAASSSFLGTDESRWAERGSALCQPCSSGSAPGPSGAPLQLEPRGLLKQTVDALHSQRRPLPHPPLTCRAPSGGRTLVAMSRAAESLCFHLPLERFLAAAALRLAAAEGGARALSLLGSELAASRVGWLSVPTETMAPHHVNLWKAACAACPDTAHCTGSAFVREVSAAQALLHVPLQLAASVSAIEANLWVRNGSSPRQQLQNYVSLSPPLCKLMADPDRVAMQLAAAVLPAELVLSAVFAAFGHLPLLDAVIWAGASSATSTLATTPAASSDGGIAAATAASASANAAARYLSETLGAPLPFSSLSSLSASPADSLRGSASASASASPSLAPAPMLDVEMAPPEELPRHAAAPRENLAVALALYADASETTDSDSSSPEGSAASWAADARQRAHIYIYIYIYINNTYI